MTDDTISVKSGGLESTGMRYHELALTRWLNSTFMVREGVPVPVIMASPLDAYSAFMRLWSDANNPFKYLLDAKDDNGTPLYQPYPAPINYPLITVRRRGYKYRSYQNFSVHRIRHINWPTVSQNVGKCELGTVTTSRYPVAWDYKFQIDFYCSQPDTLAFYVEKLMHLFYKSGGSPQEWISVNYPVWGERLVRLALEGDIEDTTPEEPDDTKKVEFRSTLNVTLEGFAIDLNFQFQPALWSLVYGSKAVSPDNLTMLFEPNRVEELRYRDDNRTLDSRSDVPDNTACQRELRPSSLPATSYLQSGDPAVTASQPDPVNGAPHVYPSEEGYAVGIDSTAEFGSASLVKV